MRTLEAKIVDSTHLELVEPLPLRPGRRVEVSIRLDDAEETPDTIEEPGKDASAKGRAEPSGPGRSREQEWRRSHGDLLRTYAGQWVVLEGEEIVAHGDSMTRLVEQARAQGIRIPYVFFVEESRPNVVTIGL